MQMASSSVDAIDKGIGEMAGAMSLAANSTELVRGNKKVWRSSVLAATAVRTDGQHREDAEGHNQRDGLNNNLHAHEPHSCALLTI